MTISTAVPPRRTKNDVSHQTAYILQSLRLEFGINKYESFVCSAWIVGVGKEIGSYYESVQAWGITAPFYCRSHKLYTAFYKPQISL
jgi:hypothetical protein